MALRLPTIVPEARVQQCLDFIARQFPIAAGALADSAKELFPELATPAARKINFGTAKLKFTASKFPEGPIAVTHGLGTTPVSVVATSENNVVTISTSGYGATTFSLWGGNWFEPINGELPVHWVAIG